MSWKSEYPEFRSIEGLVNVKAAYSRKRKSSHHPPENQSETEGPSEPDSDGNHSPPLKQTEQGMSVNPSVDAEVELSPIPEVEPDGEVPEEENDTGRTMTNPSSSDHDQGAPPFNFPEIDEDFERRTKVRQDRPQKPKENGKVASFEERTKARHDRPLPHPIRPTRNREDGTFTTRVHYNGVIEGEEGCGRQYLNGELEYIHKCDPDRWSKLEVDDVLEKQGIDVTGLDYFYLKPRMSLEDGLVRLFDNKSALEMAELGFHCGVIDVYAVQMGVVGIDATQEVVSQITQEHIGSSVRDNVSRELQFEGRQDGLTASEDDNEEIDDGAGENNQRDEVHYSEDDWLDTIGFDGEDLEGEDKMSVEGEDIYLS